MADAFRFSDGSTARDPHELLHSLETKKHRYHEHVQGERNDFANWLEYIGHPTLAKSMRDSRTREESIAALRQHERSNNIVYRERPISAFVLGIGVGVLLCLIIWAMLGALR